MLICGGNFFRLCTLLFSFMISQGQFNHMFHRRCGLQNHVRDDFKLVSCVWGFPGGFRSVKGRFVCSVTKKLISFYVDVVDLSFSSWCVFFCFLFTRCLCQYPSWLTVPVFCFCHGV